MICLSVLLRKIIKKTPQTKTTKPPKEQIQTILIFIFWALHRQIFEDTAFSFKRGFWCFTQATADFLRELNSEMCYYESRGKQPNKSSVSMAMQLTETNSDLR